MRLRVQRPDLAEGRRRSVRDGGRLIESSAAELEIAVSDVCQGQMGQRRSAARIAFGRLGEELDRAPDLSALEESQCHVIQLPRELRSRGRVRSGRVPAEAGEVLLRAGDLGSGGSRRGDEGYGGD